MNEIDEAIVEFLREDLCRARYLLARHTPDPAGWCYHQGAMSDRYHWPCRLYRCARAAVTPVLPAQCNGTEINGTADVVSLQRP